MSNRASLPAPSVGVPAGDESAAPVSERRRRGHRDPAQRVRWVKRSGHDSSHHRKPPGPRGSRTWGAGLRAPARADHRGAAGAGPRPDGRDSGRSPSPSPRVARPIPGHVSYEFLFGGQVVSPAAGSLPIAELRRRVPRHRSSGRPTAAGFPLTLRIAIQTPYGMKNIDYGRAGPALSGGPVDRPSTRLRAGVLGIRGGAVVSPGAAGRARRARRGRPPRARRPRGATRSPARARALASSNRWGSRPARTSSSTSSCGSRPSGRSAASASRARGVGRDPRHRQARRGQSGRPRDRRQTPRAPPCCRRRAGSARRLRPRSKASTWPRATSSTATTFSALRAR